MSAPTFEAGDVVYLAVGGELVIARVDSLQGSRLVTVDLGGVRRVVARDRLYWGGAAQVSDAAGLERHWEAVSARVPDCDLELTWEFLGEAGDMEAQPVSIVAELALGVGDGVETDALAVAVFSGTPYFKLRKWRLHPASPEALEAAGRAQEDEERAARELEEAVEGLSARLEGGDLPVTRDGTALRRHIHALVDVALHGPEASQGALGRVLMERLGKTGKGGEAAWAFRKLVDLGEFSEDENLAVRRAGIRQGFSAEVLEEADAVAQTAPGGGDPKDLRDLYTVAIDSAGTSEVDDAFAIEGERLHVFIADVAAYVEPGGVLDDEALRRISTVYLPEGKIPMLPPALSEGVASLQPDEDRRALCFSGEMGEDGRLVGFEICEALCRVDRRLTYVEADAMLEGEADADAASSLVERAARFCLAHRARRSESGALLLQRHEVEISVLDGGQVQATPVHASGPARQLVSEMMVSTCAAVGAWCHDQQVPCVYRAQPDPDVSPGVEGTEVTDTIEQLRVLRRLKPSGLTTRPLRHYTLGISGYTQVTSPIRRYMDLVMHRQIKSALRRRRPPCGEGDLQGLFDTVERTSGAIRRAAMESRRFWILRLLEQQPDTRWRALALRSLGRRWLVELQDLAFSAAITDGAPFQEGEELTLEVADVDARRDHLQLKVVERSRP